MRLVISLQKLINFYVLRKITTTKKNLVFTLSDVTNIWELITLWHLTPTLFWVTSGCDGCSALYNVFEKVSLIIIENLIEQLSK